MKPQASLQALGKGLRDFPKAIVSPLTRPYIAVSVQTAFAVTSTCATGARYWVCPVVIIDVLEHLQSSLRFQPASFTGFPILSHLRRRHCSRQLRSRCTLFP